MGNASPPPQEQMQVQTQEPDIINNISWYEHPSVIGPILAAIIVAIIGPLIVLRVKNKYITRIREKYMSTKANKKRKK